MSLTMNNMEEAASNAAMRLARVFGGNENNQVETGRPDSNEDFQTSEINLLSQHDDADLMKRDVERIEATSKPVATTHKAPKSIKNPDRPTSAARKQTSSNTEDSSSSSLSSQLLFSMDTIVRQIRDDIISRCTKIRERVGAMRHEDKQELGIVPEEYRADLEKRLADLMIVGERSGLSRHKLCVYELECHFHIKIAMVHLEGPTDSLDKAIQLYRMGQYAEALPMLEQQLEKTTCYLHELIAGSMFNLGRIDDAGFHYQQAIKNMKSKTFSERTIRTDKQQSNLFAAARNAKAKAGESLKNNQLDNSKMFYEMSNDLYSAIENKREALEGMLLCIGGVNDVIQAITKSDNSDNNSLHAKTALQVILRMQDKLSDVVMHSGLDSGFQFQCLGVCLSIVASSFEATGRYTAAISRYRDSQEAYSKLADDKTRVLRMRECVMKARHVVRALVKTLGRANSEGELTTPVRQGMSIVLQMHDSFMAGSDRAKVEPTFRAENQAECLNSVGIGHYELRQFDQAETLLQRGVDIMKEKFGANCRHITLAQLLYNMGLLYQDIGQLVKARNCYEDARALYNRIEDMTSRDEGMKKTQEALEDIE